MTGPVGSTEPDDWQPLLRDLEARRGDARAMGGAERIEARRESGRLNARERIDALLDPGSFVELGALVGAVHRGVTPPAPADGLVGGHGLIDGRRVVVGSEDFTVMGGSIGIGTHAKRIRLASLAGQEGVPLVMLLEGAGERSQNAFERYPYSPNDLQVLARNHGRIPMVSVVMGPSAGHGALTAPLSDFVVMVEGASLFSAGPALVRRATGEEVTAAELGGTAMHTTLSGVAHNAAPDDRAALALVRRYLSYLPSHAGGPTPPVDTIDGGDTGPRALDGILELIPADPRKVYDIRAVIELMADAGSVFEVQPAFGRTIVTALARLGGRPVAVVANQPGYKAGAIDRDGADKATAFLESITPFRIPVITLADNPGVMAGTQAEQSGILRAAARMYLAQSRVRAPKLAVALRKAYGFGSSVMAMNPFDGQTVVLAFPGARLGAMPAEGAQEVAGLDGNPELVLQHSELGGAYSSADTMAYDDVIDPRELRDALLDALSLAAERPRGGPRGRGPMGGGLTRGGPR
ncbi:MAG: acetyl-CoA carboxylase carboxyltransferase subunit [Actinomycetia bacterium]|nr:acetyl-CoA carboxylase carboxyltransferase subunit [Actinomycetes bacterium]